ncbi:MAG: trimeric intracellular cation channel family protein [Bacteroidaceae bacterium]|nr:trimeric intracellular cation channel family protein [Bacteroidaceae bacterium]
MTITFPIEIIGTIAFAISGVRLAGRRDYDLFGGFVLAWVTAVGGGTLRDVMLGQVPFWMTSPLYIICTFGALILVQIFSRLMDKMNKAWVFFDTLGLALFTIAGMQKTLDCGQPMWVAIMMGCITGVAGGVIRDVLASIPPVICQKDIYAMSSILGGCVYALLLQFDLDSLLISVITFFFITIVRLLGLRYNIELPKIRMSEDKKHKV